MTFDQWMDELEAWLAARDLPCTADLADYRYRDAFEDGLTAEEAAAEVLLDNDYDLDELLEEVEG